MKLPLERARTLEEMRACGEAMVPSSDVIQLEAAYALLLARCEAAEAIVRDLDDASRVSHLTDVWDVWVAAKAAHVGGSK